MWCYIKKQNIAGLLSNCVGNSAILTDTGEVFENVTSAEAKSIKSFCFIFVHV